MTRAPDLDRIDWTTLPPVLRRARGRARHALRGARSVAVGRARARRSTPCGCSASPPATTATSRTAPTGPRGPSSSCSRSSARRRAEGARSGGPRTTAIITATRTAPRTCTRRCSAASGGATSAGSSSRRHDATKLDRVKDSRALPRAALARPVPPASCPLALARRLFLAGGLPGAAVGLLRVDRAPLARHVRDQLARPRARPAALRDRRRLAQQPRARARHASARAGTTTTTSTRRARSQGFFWWELDVSYYALRGLAALRVVRDLRAPPPRRPRTAIRAAGAGAVAPPC